ncbi:hypothetical protein B0T22DRAFT_464197 [Podospora appendiculata]|uniref:Uncharacterized protein n=1 Tax=Podospora appendiculata TaxID=314037 RepID=A0AAE0X4J3_9PEZI|nr:hypothetical protein B0T22DRAFT_464197 [Podospora appendiculata]
MQYQYKHQRVAIIICTGFGRQHRANKPLVFCQIRPDVCHGITRSPVAWQPTGLLAVAQPNIYKSLKTGQLAQSCFPFLIYHDLLAAPPHRACVFLFQVQQVWLRCVEHARLPSASSFHFHSARVPCVRSRYSFFYLVSVYLSVCLSNLKSHGYYHHPPLSFLSCLV